jgi:hypothetical protein
MINIKSKVTQFLVATIFSLALLLPTAVQFAHTFEGHEHKPCTDAATHLHEKKLNCSIDSFHFSFFDITLHTIAISTQTVIVKKKLFVYNEHPTISDKRFIKLRGPPVNLYSF